MAVGIVDRQKLVDIADAVRAKKGITGNMTLDAIASNITSIPTADNNAKFDFSGSGSKSSGGLLSYITTVDLSNLDTSNYTDMSAMFQNCTSITSLDVSNFNTSKVTDMGHMFNNCYSLTSLDLHNFDTTNATDMESMFQSCTSLTNLDVSSFNTSKVGGYGGFKGMFSYCNSLETLDISNFDFSNVKDGSYYGLNSLFFKCSKLSTINFPPTVTFNNSGISLNSMFSNCSSLTTLDLSNFDTSNVQYMESMFSNCPSLITLDLSSFNTSKVTNMSSMFNYCSKLSNLTLGNDWSSNSSISSFDLSFCPLTRESAVDVINKLATRSNSPVITFSNQVRLYQSEIDVATNKGWSVSGCSLIVEDPSTATVGQSAIIDGELSKCTYVADTAQSWGQRVFIAVSSFTDSNGNSTFEWGGYETATGITARDVGTGLSNTNSLIAMNLQSTDGTPTIWDAITEFRNTHSDSWFVPSMYELTSNSTNAWSSSEYSSNSTWARDNSGSNGVFAKNNKYGLKPAIYV